MNNNYLIIKNGDILISISFPKIFFIISFYLALFPLEKIFLIVLLDLTLILALIYIHILFSFYDEMS